MMKMFMNPVIESLALLNHNLGHHYAQMGKRLLSMQSDAIQAVNSMTFDRTFAVPKSVDSKDLEDYSVDILSYENDLVQLTGHFHRDLSDIWAKSSRFTERNMDLYWPGLNWMRTKLPFGKPLSDINR